MTHDELVQRVRVELRRYDLAEQIASNIRSVLLSEHGRQAYAPDLTQVTHDFASEAARNTITSIYSTYPTLRSIRSIYVCDASGQELYELKKADGSSMLTGGVFRKVNVWYRAGTALNTVTYEPHRYVRINYLANPNTDPLSLSSWMLDEAPEYIVHRVAAQIYSGVLANMPAAQGQLASAAAHYAKIAEHILEEAEDGRE